MDWAVAPHVTDASIAEWWCLQTRGRAPDTHEAAELIDRFLDNLGQALKDAPQRFRVVPGAPALLRRLRTLGWHTGIATGGWGRSARVKLEAAGLREEVVLASSDDTPDRIEIFRLAQRRALQAASEPVSRTILVGDAPWDVRVASVLGWPFVGVAAGARAGKLRQAGAAEVIADFLEVDTVLRLLERATVPGVDFGPACSTRK
jgi:phosphoglycolate phosphatase-like HAD superfamily hydrolase